MSNGVSEYISNTLLSIGTSSWAAVGFLTNIDLFLGLILKLTGIASFIIYVIINRKKIIKAIKEMFDSCPE